MMHITMWHITSMTHIIWHHITCVTCITSVTHIASLAYITHVTHITQWVVVKYYLWWRRAEIGCQCWLRPGTPHRCPSHPWAAPESPSGPWRWPAPTPSTPHASRPATHITCTEAYKHIFCWLKQKSIKSETQHFDYVGNVKEYS